MVMYRDFVTRKARLIGSVAGFVRNNEDGSVMVVAEGERGALEKLIGYVRTGPLFSKVDDVQVVWKEATDEFNDFTIAY